MTKPSRRGRSLQENEAIIERGLQTFYEVGHALLDIRDGRQYREAGWETFAEYARDRWAMSLPYANQIIAAAQTTEVLRRSMTAIAAMPTAEAQVRPLTTLPPDEQPDAWQEAVRRNAGNVPPARLVAEVVRERRQSRGVNITTALGNIATASTGLRAFVHDFLRMEPTEADRETIGRALHDLLDGAQRAYSVVTANLDDDALHMLFGEDDE